MTDIVARRFNHGLKKHAISPFWPHGFKFHPHISAKTRERLVQRLWFEVPIYIGQYQVGIDRFGLSDCFTDLNQSQPI